MSSRACQGIVPPYLLQRLAASGDPTLADHAKRTLAHDLVLRARPDRPSQVAAAATSTAALRRTVDDARHGTDLPGTVVRNEGDPAVADAAVNEAYDGLGATWRLYQEVYGRNSIDGAGLPLIASVHYDTNYDNAFWNGAQMVFGDGDGTVFLGFTRSVDVIGHELTHGVTAATANLTYSGQSGALNEHVSDVFGSLVKQRALGQDAAHADWLIGADLLAPGVHGVALRSMKAPGTAYDDPRLGKDPQPADMAGYVQTSEDNGGVHLNSGIPNRAFYLVATAIGGNAWEEAGQIWYDVLTGSVIRPDCDFATFAGLTRDAATARYGTGAGQVTAVEQAWSTVGVSGSTAAPAPGGATPAAELTVRRTGGVGGLRLERSLSLEQLPAPDASQWHDLLSGDRLTALGGSPADPDAFHYTVLCPGAGVEVTVPDHALSSDVRDLLERTIRG